MKKILLADDSITIQKVVELTFSEGDYQVVCVSNGAQALRKVPEILPDVILLDVIMPEKNGYEVCEALKRNPSTSGIPVLLLTGTFEPFDKRRAEAIGANGHLTKPFESHALVSKVDELIAARPKLVPPERAGAMDIIAGGEVRHLDASGGVGPTPEDSSRPPSPVPQPMPATNWDIRPAEPTTPHPALATPDPGAGGSYLGFADLEAGSRGEGDMIPDRYDSVAPAHSSTVRISREEMFAAPGSGGAPASHAEEEGAFKAPMEGFTSGYDMPLPSGQGRGPAEPRSNPKEAIASGRAAPDAAPLDSWHRVENPSEAPAAATPTADLAAAPDDPIAARPDPTGPSSPLHLSPEAIERIANEVVRRISDRVVREIAWEIIPQVAETLVTRRIKELEEGGGN